MTIGSVSNNRFSNTSALNFKGDSESAKTVTKPETTVTTTVSATVKKDTFVKTEEPKVIEKPKSSLTKKIAVGCVGLCPGLGQFVNGQWMKAVGFAVGVPLAAMAGFFIGGYPGLAIIGGAYLWNVIDAVSNA